MKTAAIIAEYNPFHKGHDRHIKYTREKFGATHIVAIMSGNFVQRGDAACLSKRERTEMALRGGVDLVVELPTAWAMSSAEHFAAGGVQLAAALGCVDMLSFGSECGDIESITAAARAADAVDGDAMRRCLSQGMTYAAARQLAVRGLDIENAERSAELFGSPNDTLGIEYCRALEKYAKGIQPVCIKREGGAHDSAEAGAISAMAVRRLMRDGELSQAAQLLPESSYEILKNAVSAGNAPADISRLDRALIMKLRTMTERDIAALPDVSEGLENRILSCVREQNGTQVGFESLCAAVKSKRYTLARIRRVVVCALLDISRQITQGTPPYLRILGMNERGREILGSASPTLPIISRYADVAALDERARAVFAAESRAADIFALTLPNAGCAGAEERFKLVKI